MIISNRSLQCIIDKMRDGIEIIITIRTQCFDVIIPTCFSPGNLEAAIKKGLLVRYFNLLGGTDAAYALIDQVLAVVRAGSTMDKQ